MTSISKRAWYTLLMADCSQTLAKNVSNAYISSLRNSSATFSDQQIDPYRDLPS